MKKVLIITYYWPPSGGAGVQRWLKLSKYLSRSSVEVHVLTIDSQFASFPVLDHSLEKDIEDNVTVHRSKGRNYFKFYESIVGKKNVPTSGYSNVDSQKLSQKFISTVRSHLFIPDPRKGWNSFAVSKAMKIIEEYKIDNIITTSPPHSTQLIGLELKRRMKELNWIADFRDPWTDIYYYNLLGHTKYSNSIDKFYEKSVLENANQITTASYGFKELFLSKNDVDIEENKIKVITNGFDVEDFDTANVSTGEVFTLTYTGTMSEQYSPEVVFDAFARLQIDFPNECKFKIIGTLSPVIEEYAINKNVAIEYVEQVPHSEIVKYQMEANILLLSIPDVGKANGIIPGKLFEYLASRNQILVVGPRDGDVARIVSQAEAGRTFSREEEDEIYHFLKAELEKFLTNGKELIPFENIKQFERSEQANEFKELLH